MTEEQAFEIRLALDGQFDPSWIAEALAHAATVPLVGDEREQRFALVAAVARPLHVKVNLFTADVRALEARNAAREREMAARDAAYELQRMDCGTTVH